MEKDFFFYFPLYEVLVSLLLTDLVPLPPDQYLQGHPENEYMNRKQKALT